MKILFISGVYPYEYIDELRLLSRGNIQNAPNVFQWAMIEGMQLNNADFDVVSFPFLPTFPRLYRKLKTPSGNVIYNGKKIGNMLSYNSLIAYKTFSISSILKQYAEEWVKKNSSYSKLVFLTYSPYFPFIEALSKVKKRYPDRNIEIVSVVTDLVDDMHNFKDGGWLKKVYLLWEQWRTKYLYRHIDKFVLLTEPMCEQIPESKNRHIVIEGMALSDGNFMNSKKDSQNKIILYTGTLQKFSGLDKLISAFIKIKNPNARLVICGGDGELVDFVQKSAEIDKRIIYKGLITREEAVILQKSATLLVNPRRPDNSITRYSFPSKTIEYLSSGTPMIGYKLEGIPEEYYNYYYTIDSLEEKELIDKLENLLSLPQSELNEMGEKAYNFIANHKTAKIQVCKILEFCKSE